LAQPSKAIPDHNTKQKCEKENCLYVFLFFYLSVFLSYVLSFKVQYFRSNFNFLFFSFPHFCLKAERQKGRKAERQKDRYTKRHKDTNIQSKRQKDRETERQKDTNTLNSEDGKKMVFNGAKIFGTNHFIFLI
jgi:hypothetical protein